MSGFRVDLDQLADLVDSLAEFGRRLESAMQAADDHMARAHRSWSGQAAAEQRAVHERWREGAERMREGLATMQGIAAGAHRNYTNAVAANRQMWG